jgi:insecticidal toxin complex protein TccC
MSVDHAHRGTPTLAVSDSRGLAVRTIQYHRRLASDPVEARVTHQRFDAAGRPVASRDPYLFALAQGDASVPANLSQVFSLSGAPLSSDSVDAGWRVALQGAAGQTIEHWDGRGSHSLTEFDELLRPVAVHERGKGLAEFTLERFTYAAIDADAASHNLCGQLLRHDDPAGTLHLRELGIAGEVLQQTRHFLLDTHPANWPDNVHARDALVEPIEGAITSWHYAASGELLKQIDALGNSQCFTYSVAGELKDTRLTLAGDGQKELTLVSDLQYNTSGQIESETAGNGIVTRHRYDPADGRLIGLSAHKANGTPLQDLKYRYDAIGNVLSLEDDAQPIRYFNNQRIEPIKTYRYDTLDQLIEATGWEVRTGHSGPALPDLQPTPLDPNQVVNYTQTYHYDAGGNLLDLLHTGAQAHSRTLTRAKYSNRCLPERSGRPPTEEELAAGFDANGNLRELQAGQSMTWDLRNQLSTVRPVVREDGNDDYERYVYDGGGQRVRKLRSTQTNARTLVSEVRYLPGVEIRSHGGTGEILHVLTVSAGSNCAQVLHWVAQKPDDITNDQMRYSLNDHLQSSALELDQNADLISQEWYYPFGSTACFAARSATEATYKTVRYSGKERDATGLYYYGFRYYAPWLQRWINPDPAGDLDGLNRYKMVRNNPVVFLDPNGLAPEHSDTRTENKKNDNSRQLSLNYYDKHMQLRLDSTPEESKKRFMFVENTMQHKRPSRYEMESEDGNNHFFNEFQRDFWVFKENFREPQVTKYFASDVLTYQYITVSKENSFFGYLPSGIKLDTVINEKTLRETKNLKNNSKELLEKFTNNTPIGKSTTRSLKELGLNILSITQQRFDLDDGSEAGDYVLIVAPSLSRAETSSRSVPAVASSRVRSPQRQSSGPFSCFPRLFRRARTNPPDQMPSTQSRH